MASRRTRNQYAVTGFLDTFGPTLLQYILLGAQAYGAGQGTGMTAEMQAQRQSRIQQQLLRGGQTMERPFMSIGGSPVTLRQRLLGGV